MNCSSVSLPTLFSLHFLSNFTFWAYMSVIVSFSCFRVSTRFCVRPIGAVAPRLLPPALDYPAVETLGRVRCADTGALPPGVVFEFFDA